MEFRNTKVSADLVPEGTDQLYQGHVVKAEAVWSFLTVKTHFTPMNKG